MRDDLKVAFDVLERRGLTAGADTVADRAMLAAFVTGSPRSRRTRWLAAAASIAAVAVITGGVYVRSQAERIRRVDVSAAITDPASGYGPMNVLVVGSDRGGGAAGQRADLIMIVRVDPTSRRAIVVSIPRDVVVETAPARKERLSAVFDRGPSALIAAISEGTGIEIDHFVAIEFHGFRAAVSRLGGVRVPFSAPQRDASSGLDVPAGCVLLDADQALAFVRSRHVESLEGGVWKVDPTGDLGRIQRQQVLIRQLIVAAGSRSPVTMARLVDALAHDIVVDSKLSMTTLLRLVRDFRDVGPSAITMLTLPTNPATVEGAAVLTVDEAAAAPMFSALSDSARPSDATSSHGMPDCR